MEFLTSLHAYGDWGLIALRIAVGAIFLAHGTAKLKNPKASAAWKALGAAETLGAAGVLLGLLTQPAAAGLSIVMVGAIYMKTVKWNSPFLGIEKLGWELDLMILAGTLTLLLMGAGAISLDRYFGV